MARLVPLFFLVLTSMAVTVLAIGNDASTVPNLPAEIRSDQPHNPKDRAVLQAIEGSLSCGKQGCHGRLDPVPHQPLLLNEATTWFAQDPHASAYEILKEERSRQMADRLNGPGKPAHLDARCLACHANPVAAKFAEEHQGELWSNPALAREFDRAATRGTGVGCEACHTSPGHYTGEYLAKHLDWGPTALGPGNWKSSGRLDIWEASGLAPLTRPGTMAGLCSSCHVGSPGSVSEPVRDCGHDIMAAGHPRLIYDAATYLSQLPSHWNNKQYVDPETRMAHLHVIGQAVAARQLVSLSASHARRDGGQWPEFADMDCFSCHSGLGTSTDSWRHGGWLTGKLGLSSRPGHFVACRMPVALTASLATNPKVDLAMETWAKSVGLGRKADVARSADALLVELEKWLSDAKGESLINPDKRAELLLRIGASAGRAIEHGRWDEAEASTVSLYWLSRGINPVPAPDLFEAAFAALAFPKGYQGPVGFHGPEKKQAIKKLADWARNQAGR